MKIKIFLILTTILTSVVIYFLYRFENCTRLPGIEPKLSANISKAGENIQVCFPHLFFQSFLKGIPFKIRIYKDGSFYKQLFFGFWMDDLMRDDNQHDYLVEILDLHGKRLLLSYPAVIFPSQQQNLVEVNWIGGRPKITDVYSYIKVVGLEKLKYVVLKNLPTGEDKITRVVISIDGKTKEIVSSKIFRVTNTDNSLEPLVYRGLVNPYVLIKYDSTFNSNSFLWDDAFTAWFSINENPMLVKNTLDFWYALQIKEGVNKGLIPREVRNTNYALALSDVLVKQEINPVSVHPLTSDQINGPYILSRVELELFKKTKNKSRLKTILPYQISYFKWVETMKKSEMYISRVGQSCPIYSWSNFASGMDNSPRDAAGWFDLAAQQVALAKDITEIAYKVGDLKTYREYSKIFSSLKVSVQKCYFDEDKSLWYDINADRNLDNQNPTAASFWGIYAGLATPQQLHKIIDKWLINPKEFGGYPPLPSLPRSNKFFEKKGEYWRGGQWPPLWWLVIHGLRQYGFKNESMSLSQQVVKLMADVYKTEGSIFEFYSPTQDINGHPHSGSFGGGEARREFLGWGKLLLYLR